MVGAKSSGYGEEPSPEYLREKESQERISQSSEKISDEGEEENGKKKTKQTFLGKGEQVKQIKERTGSGVMRRYLGRDEPSYVRSEEDRSELQSAITTQKALRRGAEDLLSELSAREKYLKDRPVNREEYKQVLKKKRALKEVLGEIKEGEEDLKREYTSGYTLRGGIGELAGTIVGETWRSIRESPYNLAEDIRTSKAYQKELRSGKKYQKLSRAFERGQQKERAEYERGAAEEEHGFARSERRKDIGVKTEEAFAVSEARTTGSILAKQRFQPIRVQPARPRVFKDAFGQRINYDPDPTNVFGTKSFGTGEVTSGTEMGISQAGLKKAHALLGFSGQALSPEQQQKQMLLRQLEQVSPTKKPVRTVEPTMQISIVSQAASGMRAVSQEELNNWLITGSHMQKPAVPVRMEQRSFPKKAKAKAKSNPGNPINNPVMTSSLSMFKLDTRGYSGNDLLNIRIPETQASVSPKHKASKKQMNKKKEASLDFEKYPFTGRYPG